MKKWVLLVITTAVLIFVGLLWKVELKLHDTYMTMVGFFAVQTFVLFRLEQWVPKEWAVQLSMVKIALRLLSSLVFILILMLNNSDLFTLVVQFIIIYLIYMVFEIGNALTNLRQN